MSKVERTPAAFSRAVCLFDLHLPEHDREFWAVTLAFLEATQPDTIYIGGDGVDAESVSSHGGNPTPPRLKAELAAVLVRLRELRARCPRSRIVWLEGNHETRLTRFITEAAPALHGLIDLPSLLHFEELRIEWVPEGDQPVREGSCKILHGHQMEGGGQYPARKLVEVWGEPGVTVLCGHFHQYQVVRKIMHPRPAVGIVVGCGRTKQPGWKKGPSGWQHRLAVIDTLPNKRSKVSVVDVDDGTIVWGSRVFSARSRRSAS